MKKKKITAIAAGILAGIMILGTTASAAPELRVGLTDNTYYVNGQQVELAAYKINGNNYVKLRDLGELVDFGVEYEHSTGKVTIDPSVPYTPEATAQTPKEFNDVPYKTISLKESDPNYYKELWGAELYNYKMLRNFPTMYINKDWVDGQNAGITLKTMDPDSLTDADKAKILKAKETREAMGQLIPYSEEVLYIWGSDMPVITENVESKFTVDSHDNADFRPFLVPYLMKDPSQAKGNLILISGGGNYLRGTEAQDVAPFFVKLGYNCFVLQRRVAPYSADEIAMDLQRAIRYVKFHGEDMGLGGLNIIGAAGFSGGGGNVRTVLEKFYGDITPDQFDKDYKCDEIDKVNSDMQIAIPIYSGGKLKTENPNLPKMFIAVGENDSFTGSIEMFQQAQELGLDPELHIFGNVGHGFGPGISGTSATTWMSSADLYIQNVFGLNKRVFDSIPAEYTLMQTVDANAAKIFPSDMTVSPVDIYVNSDYSRVLIHFQGWGDDIWIEGILVGDNVASVTYDSVGFFGNDAQKLFDLCDASAWVPVQ